jgi:hypothetical protein
MRSDIVDHNDLRLLLNNGLNIVTFYAIVAFVMRLE